MATLRIAADPAVCESLYGLDRSVRVATAATLLDADESHIRQLLREGELEGHRLGKRGVRISVASIEAYRQRGIIQPATKRSAPKAAKPAPVTAAHREALAALREMGVLAQPAVTKPTTRRRG
ncbi:excisionase family DNA binding protein [Azospirillum agricola]|uniref:helix-turn-helix domain-containing protein n=1 Tax=Azospirillum agricola TaxID=1720247 RepID=UPI001AEA6BA7|nr:excisionase family DNA binding protein [Azospirillum agricola]